MSSSTIIKKKKKSENESKKLKLQINFLEDNPIKYALLI